MDFCLVDHDDIEGLNLNEKELIQKTVPLIVAWYRENQRMLPWRENPTPYTVWLSETMLQQTRIEAAIPYYHRFLREFPTVEALAASSDDRLMKAWEGLGYYSRARNLKKTAEIVVSSCGGKFPSEAKELRKLPGIGDYTAGAVASIAFGQPEPAVDGNVLRVLTRVTACGEDILRDKTKKMFAGWLRWEYPSGSDAALLTEGLMELGEVVCIPNGVPKCAVCPLSAFCRAKLSGTVEKYPVKTPKKQRKAEEKTVFLLSYRGKYALCRRGEKGLLAGMWEFPNTEGCLSEKEAETFLRAKGAELLCCLPCGKAKHIFTHIEWLLTGYEAECREEINGFVWKTPEEIRRDYAIPSAFGYFFKRLPEM